MGGMPDQPEYDPAVEYQKGTADLQAGTLQERYQRLPARGRDDPAGGQRLALPGHVEIRRGRHEKGAEKAYEKSVKLDDSSVQAHRQLALSLIKLKQTDKASAELALLKSKAATCGDTCSDAADSRRRSMR